MFLYKLTNYKLLPINKIFILTLFLVDGIVYATNFNKKIKNLEYLTYPNSKWKPDDFGEYPNKKQKSLLKEFSPNFYIYKNSCAPMNFYQQFLPILRVKDKNKLFTINRTKLKQLERNFNIKLKVMSKPDCIESKNPPLYSYTWQETIKLADSKIIKIKILKYAFSFYKSGLAIKRPIILNAVTSILGDKEFWHYLDIHGAIFYFLNEKNQPIVLVIGQHNHFRTYIIGVDITKEQSKNICYAISSNEPYLCHEDKEDKLMPTAPIPRYMRWIITAKDIPWVGSWDKVPGLKNRKKLSYKIEFLPSKDPLITSWISLAPNLKIWGFFDSYFRKAPPGMAIYTNPITKNFWETALYYYFNPNNDAIFKEHFHDDRKVKPIKLRKGYNANIIYFTKRFKIKR